VALEVGKPVARKALEVLQAAREQQKPSFVASECPLAAVREEKRRTISAMKKNPIMCISTRHVMGFAIARRRRA
jgi:hypothetical protein